MTRRRPSLTEPTPLHQSLRTQAPDDSDAGNDTVIRSEAALSDAGTVKGQVSEPTGSVDSPQLAGEAQVIGAIPATRKDGTPTLTARGYSWPPFEPGNVAHLTHGARSERMIEARAAEVHEQLLELAPWCDRPHFLPSVHRYLRAAARERMLDEFIAGTVADKGAGKVPSRTWEQATAATRLAHTLAGDLGLTPLGEARLRAVAGTAAVTELSLADLMAQGAVIRKAAEARHAAQALEAGHGTTEGPDDGD